MKSIFEKLAIAVIVLMLTCGFLVIVSSSLLAVASNKEFALDPGVMAIFYVFMLVGFGGLCGGMVHAMENDKTHKIKLKGIEVDTGASGHMFIGFCGAIVALALVLIIFRLDLSPAFNSSPNIAKVVEYIVYLLAIGVIGGYSGLKVISVVSNAAIKKIQEEVNSLKKSGKETKDAVKALKLKESQLKGEVKGLQKREGKLKQELDNLTLSDKELRAELYEQGLKNTLLTAESYVGGEDYQKAIDLINDKYLPHEKENPQAYIWLAYCEKRRGNLNNAIMYANKAIELQPSRLGYYNLACYLHLDGSDPIKVLSKLKLAGECVDKELEGKRLLKSLLGDTDLATFRQSPPEGYEPFLEGLQEKYNKT